MYEPPRLSPACARALRLAAAVAVAVAIAAPANAAAAQAPRELKLAIRALGRFHRDLYAPSARFRAGSHELRPRLTRPHPIGSGEPLLVFGVAGSLVGGRLFGGIAQLGGRNRFSHEYAGELAALGGGSPGNPRVRALNSTVFVESGIQQDTDVLYRPTSFGWSIYVQIRSRRAHEHLEFQGPECEAGSFIGEGQDYFAHLGRGGLAILKRRHPPACPEALFTMAAPAQTLPADFETGPSYRHELRLLHSANQLARNEHASLVSLVEAGAARDAGGTVVPTSSRWGGGEGTEVMTIHHRGAAYRYPIVEHLLFITLPG